MVGNAQMQQLVRNDEVLKSGSLFDQIGSKGHDSRCRARPPLLRHALNPHQSRSDMQSLRPVLDAGTNSFALFVTFPHQRLRLEEL